eukprot:7734448-Pyramimonas_sp.AAC.1
MWGLSLTPLTVEAVNALGASLKAGRYRSARLHLSAARVEAERQGRVVDQCTARALKDAVRS